MDYTADQPGASSAEGLLALIERHLPALWHAHAHSGSRALRTVLRRAEALLAAQAGVDVASFRQMRRQPSEETAYQPQRAQRAQR